jgi:hypothetical protein
MFFSDPPTPPGSPLKAQEGDLVSWSNQTKKEQMITVFKAGTQVESFSTKAIPSFGSSAPGYVIQAADIDTKNPPAGAAGTVRYVSTFVRPDKPSEGPGKADGTITVVKA